MFGTFQRSPFCFSLESHTGTYLALICGHIEYFGEHYIDILDLGVFTIFHTYSLKYLLHN